jgi:hypothetical protein
MESCPEALLNPRDLLSENSFTKCSVVFNRSVIDRFVCALPEHHNYWGMFKLQRELWRLLKFTTNGMHETEV